MNGSFEREAPTTVPSTIAGHTPEADVELGVRAILRDRIGFEPAALRASARLADLGMDMLDSIEFVIAARQRWRIQIPEVEVTSAATIADLIDIVRRHRAEGARGR